nr:hypothetical protein GCM10020063_009430 [Dactylosporangium thailandense]
MRTGSTGRIPRGHSRSHPQTGSGLRASADIRDRCHMSTGQSSDEGKKAADRAALEQILGRPLPREWPSGSMPSGTRVRVVKDADWDGPWRHEFLGTIDDMGAPEPVLHDRAWPGELKYWITFDEPQFDHAGDGPYRKAQIWSRYLQLAGEQNDARP